MCALIDVFVLRDSMRIIRAGNADTRQAYKLFNTAYVMSAVWRDRRRTTNVLILHILMFE